MLLEIEAHLRVGEVFKVQQFRYGNHVDFYSHLLLEKGFKWEHTASNSDRLKYGRDRVEEALKIKKIMRFLTKRTTIYGVCIEQKEQHSLIYFFGKVGDREKLIARIGKLGDAGNSFEELYYEKLDEEKPVVLESLADYHPYRNYDGTYNPDFDTHSKNILDLKDQENHAIDYFYQQLNDRIKSMVIICIVPSSNAKKIESGICDLGKKLAQQKERTDGTHCLRRHTSIEKVASGGPRYIKPHLDSICVEDKELFQGKKVLLLDDIATSESSISACQELLLRAGAKRVEKIVLGRTRR
ncbi:hypothetical protein GH741_11710 [Aquibacillus halophilus]|uniref:Phosphoribosyltransferase domain-containing protein n=1 Tax=Aquibacillus halophilus TaxID=930132 RepID=A0A6A8DCB5_9BACI|nr:hypothetical protein [Aquibacillus halophilus]MRH43345.1 hypothetical protein [Aquibacillus halophilus]